MNKYSPVEIRENKVVIGLPEWICEDKYERKSVFYYPSHHAWAGSFDRTETTNMIVDELLDKVTGAENVMSHPMNCNIEVVIEDGVTAQQILKEVCDILANFHDKEYVKEVTKTIYYGKLGKF